MKKYIALLTIISVIVILSACSSKTSLELKDTKVEFINDKEKTAAGKEVVTTSLFYTFTIKNEVSKELVDNPIPFAFKIEPNEKLLTVSKEITGFNIFNPQKFDNISAGYNLSFAGFLEPNTEEQVILHFHLGLPVPSKEQLEKLKNNALDATLIVSSDNEEIARFDLNKKE